MGKAAQMKSVMNEKTPCAMSMFITISEEKHLPGSSRFQTLSTGLHWKILRKKRARWVTMRNMIRMYRMRFTLLNWDKRRRNRQIDILHVASAMKN